LQVRGWNWERKEGFGIGRGKRAWNWEGKQGVGIGRGKRGWNWEGKEGWNWEGKQGVGIGRGKMTAARAHNYILAVANVSWTFLVETSNSLFPLLPSFFPPQFP
jgi:hypothetical protein